MDQKLELPENFFADECLQPRFYMPENEELRWATHNSIKRTLFFNVFTSIRNIEFKRLRTDQDFFEFQRLETDAPEGWVDSVVERVRRRNDLLLGIHFWVLSRSGKEVRYRVRYYQTDADQFMATLWPVSWKDAFTHLRVNRQHLRIL